MSGLADRLRGWLGRTPAPPNPPPVPPAVALSNRLAYRLHNSRYAGSPTPGQTLSTLLHLDAEPTWVRLVYVNDQPDQWAVDAATLAPSAAVGDGCAPVNAKGRADPTLWRPVTFQSSGHDSEPLPPSDGAPGTLKVPGTPYDPFRPAHALSDWMPVKALPRQDGGTGWLLLVRTFSRGTMRFAAGQGQPDRAIGRLHAGFRANGDQTRASAASFERDDRMFACHGVQFITDRPGATVLGIGDSIIHSSCTSGEMSGYGIRACAALSRPGRPVSYVNEGFPGRPSLGYFTNGLWALETFRPQVAIIQTWTQNDGWTTENAIQAFDRAMQLGEVTRHLGGVPIFTTASPSFGHHPDFEPIRQAANARVLALQQQGASVLDLDTLWGTGETPNRYQRAFDADGGVHPNDQACAVAAEALAPMLVRIIGS